MTQATQLRPNMRESLTLMLRDERYRAEECRRQGEVIGGKPLLPSDEQAHFPGTIRAVQTAASCYAYPTLEPNRVPTPLKTTGAFQGGVGVVAFLPLNGMR